MVKYSRKSACIKNFTEHFKEFSRSTGIHGFRYIGEPGSLIAKLFWTIIITISFIGCVYLIMRTYRKWELSPVIVSFATTATPIYHLPFPAVTICPEIKFRRKFYNYTHLCHKKMDNITLYPFEEKDFEYMSMICEQSIFLKEKERYNKTFTDDIYSFLKNATPSFVKHTIACKWMDIESDCSDFFTPIITDEGVCYTFNMLDRTELFHRNVVQVGNYHNINTSSVDWNPENMQYDSHDLTSYPRRALLSGARASFAVWMTVMKEDIDYLCKITLQGFRVLLHHPAKIPRMSYQYFRVPVDQSVIAAIRPVMITTSETLREYTPSSRGCFYPKERRLKYYSIYTQDNCLVECLTNFTLVACNCSAYYMPRMRGEPICGAGNFRCIEETEINHPILSLVYKFQKHTDLIEHFLENFNETELLDCNCLPSCTSVDYNVEISQSDWEWQKLLRSFRINVSQLNSHFKEDSVYMSNLEIFLKANQIIALERHELYGPTDFLANFGGLLGLFIGFSLVSFVEIIYFFTIRLFYKIRQFGCKYWEIEECRNLDTF